MTTRRALLVAGLAAGAVTLVGLPAIATAPLHPAETLSPEARAVLVERACGGWNFFAHSTAQGLIDELSERGYVQPEPAWVHAREGQYRCAFLSLAGRVQGLILGMESAADRKRLRAILPERFQVDDEAGLMRELSREGARTARYVAAWNAVEHRIDLDPEAAAGIEAWAFFRMLYGTQRPLRFEGDVLVLGETGLVKSFRSKGYSSREIDYSDRPYFMIKREPGGDVALIKMRPVSIHSLVYAPQKPPYRWNSQTETWEARA